MSTRWPPHWDRRIRPAVIRHGGWRWEVLPGGEEVVRSLDDWSPAALRASFGDTLLGEKGAERFSFRMQAGSLEVAVKVQRSNRFKAKLRSLYGRCKARKEWENHLVASGLGVPTVRPVALGELRRPILVHEAAVITEWQAGARALVDWRRERADRAGGETEQNLAAGIGRLAATTQKSGLYHNEIHAGNLLVAGADAEPDLLLIDWKHARIKPRTTENDVENLVRTGWFLNRGLDFAPPTEDEKRAFLAAYLEATAGRPDRAELIASLRRACPDAAWIDAADA